MTQKNPTVSILCLTYNHASYIERCLDGMLAQEADFDYEILVHDDASSDGTVDILKRYEKAHSNIKVIYQSVNQFSKGVKITPTYQLPRAKGKYIALCEGDDYWTDESKLQKQVEFMENNPDHFVCFHPVRVTHEDGSQEDFTYPDVEDEEWYTTEELVSINYIPTCSVLYRRVSYDNYPKNVSPGDWFFHLYHALHGKIKYMDEIMAVYRKHDKGLWWEYDRDRYKIWVKYGIEHLNMFVELEKLYADRGSPQYKELFNAAINRVMENLANTDVDHETDLIDQALDRYPEIIVGFIKHQASAARTLKAEVEDATRKLSDLERGGAGSKRGCRLEG